MRRRHGLVVRAARTVDGTAPASLPAPGGERPREKSKVQAKRLKGEKCAPL